MYIFTRLVEAVHKAEQKPERHYQCFPSEDVAIETDPVLREVESSLQEDVPLKSTGVVCNTNNSQNQSSLSIRYSSGLQPERIGIYFTLKSF